MRSEESRKFVKHNSCKEAVLYERLPDNTVRCNLYSHRCIISEGHKGVCRVRENRGGESGLEIPWHISRLFPAYRMRDRSPTPLDTLRRARDIGLGGG
jgi:hypothetical protein